MRLVTLFLIAAFAASTVDAASYQKIDGTIVDPIWNWVLDEPHSYTGEDLKANANLSYADLTGADLYGVNLWDADLRYASLSNAYMIGADLRNSSLDYANLSGADLSRALLTEANLTNVDLLLADLSRADLTNANLTNANLTDTDLDDAFLFSANLTNANLTGSNLTTVNGWDDAHWTDAFYYTNNVPTWASGTVWQENGMDQAWRDSAGILAIDPTSGDINGDGVFDAADYTVWQDNGGDQIDYRTWKDHFTGEFIGDFNDNGVVDAADYTVWLDNLGLRSPIPVSHKWFPWRWEDRIDYRTWKNHFGQSIATWAQADHVPEPTTLLLALLALVAAPLRVRCGTK